MEEGKIEVIKTKEEKPKDTKNNTIIGLIILTILLAGLAGYFAYKYNKSNNDNKQQQAQIDDLKKQLSAKTTLLDTAKKQADSNTPATNITPTPVPTISPSLKENVQAAINTMNTAALEGYMAPSVNVVFAASEKAGPRTPAEAVSDLAYLNSATAPWNWALPAATLASYKAGFYGTYFGANTIVGQSANKYVISFGINPSGKINVIFVSVSADLLI